MTQFKTKSAEEFRDDALRYISNSLITQLGIENPNVGFGTEYYLLMDAVSKLAEEATFNAIAVAESQMVDTALGEDLYRIAQIYNLSLKPAVGSSGALILSSTATIGLVDGLQLIDQSGLRYQVATGGLYQNLDPVPIIAVDIGSQTNLASNAILRWINPPAFVNPIATVAAPGLIGGAEEEQDEDLRNRIYNILRNPIGGGNWSQFKFIAEQSSAAIQSAYIYPAFAGPSTVQVCVVSAPTATNKNRNVTNLVLNQVDTNVKGNVFEGIYCLTTTPTNIPTKVAIGLSLPNAPTAPLPGPGGGWLDGVPFPQNNIDKYAYVQNVNSPTAFNVFSTTGATPNVSRIVYITDTWNIVHAKVLTATSGAPNIWSVTVDTPCPNIKIGDWIMPDALNIEVYINSLLKVFSQIGPGEITNLPTLLPFAYRRPLVQQSNFADLGPSVLKFLSNTGDEVLDVQYSYRDYLIPPLPTSVYDGPNILSPSPCHIGFFPL